MMRRFRYRINPTKEQADLMFRFIGAARFMYNELLSDYITQLSEYKINKEVSPKPKITSYTKIKKLYDWMENIDDSALSYSELPLN